MNGETFLVCLGMDISTWGFCPAWHWSKHLPAFVFIPYLLFLIAATRQIVPESGILCLVLHKPQGPLVCAPEHLLSRRSARSASHCAPGESLQASGRERMPASTCVARELSRKQKSLFREKKGSRLTLQRQPGALCFSPNLCPCKSNYISLSIQVLAALPGLSLHP